MKMMGQAQQAFVEAEVAYHRERLMASGNRTNRSPRPARVTWVQALIDAVSGTSRDRRHGAIRHENTAPGTRAVAAPHHVTSH